jgi:hypothetical protein
MTGFLIGFGIFAFLFFSYLIGRLLVNAIEHSKWGLYTYEDANSAMMGSVFGAMVIYLLIGTVLVIFSLASDFGFSVVYFLLGITLPVTTIFGGKMLYKRVPKLLKRKNEKCLKDS